MIKQTIFVRVSLLLCITMLFLSANHLHAGEDTGLEIFAKIEQCFEEFTAKNPGTRSFPNQHNSLYLPIQCVLGTYNGWPCNFSNGSKHSRRKKKKPTSNSNVPNPDAFSPHSTIAPHTGKYTKSRPPRIEIPRR